MAQIFHAGILNLHLLQKDIAVLPNPHLPALRTDRRGLTLGISQEELRPQGMASKQLEVRWCLKQNSFHSGSRSSQGIHTKGASILMLQPLHHRAHARTRSRMHKGVHHRGIRKRFQRVQVQRLQQLDVILALPNRSMKLGRSAAMQLNNIVGAWRSGSTEKRNGAPMSTRVECVVHHAATAWMPKGE